MKSEFSAYVPMDRRHARARDEELPEKTRGAVLFADICGYTRLTETLVGELGAQRGAEELSVHLNRTYTALIGAVHEHGGSVIGFSGDAITCWFDGDPGEAAVGCALAMQRAMPSIGNLATPAGTPVPLDIKVAVAAGDARRLLVGDEELRRLDVLVGSTLASMARAEKVAEPGEVIASAEVIAALGSGLQIAERREDSAGKECGVVTALDPAPEPRPWPRHATSEAIEEQFSQFVLPQVRSRLQSGHAEFLAEIRTVCSMFVQLPPLDFDGDDTVARKLDAIVRRIQSTITRYDGAIIDFTSNDKGSHVYVAFGAPITHEDDADRALAAATDLCTPDLPGIMIGLSRGSVRAGATGSDSRRDYAALGDAANTAARLMGRAAPGQVLASESIVQDARLPFLLGDNGEMELRGKAQPVRVYSVKRDRRTTRLDIARERRQDDLIGRRSEREVLDRRLEILRDDRIGGCIIIRGEAGIGKSQLVRHLCRRAGAKAIPTLVAGADSIERATPYFAWRVLLTQLLQGTGEPDPEKLRAALMERLERSEGERWLQLAPLLCAVLPFELPDTDLTRQMDGSVRADNTMALVVHLLQKTAAATPLLVIIEDAHWLDSASWSLVQEVAEAIPSLLMVLSKRPTSGTQAAASRAIEEAEGTEELLLTAMSEQNALDLVTRRLGVRSLPEPIARLITERAEGNPFFSEEIASALRDSGVLMIDGGECRISPDAPSLDTLDFPTTVEGLITSRLDGLSPAQQLAVKVGSVIGREFATSTVVDVYPVESERQALPQELRVVATRDILLQVPDGEPAYTFRHALSRDVAYKMMPSDLRAQLHLHLAQWYEGRPERDAATVSSLLAHHWSRALEGVRVVDPAHFEKAIHYCEVAGDRSLAASAYEEAAHFFEEAVALDRRRHEADPSRQTTASKRAHWQSRLGLARLGLTQYRESRQHHQQALRLLGQPMPLSTVPLAAMVFGQTVVQALHGIWPRRWLELHSPERRERMRALARIYIDLAESHYMFGELLPLVGTGLRALNSAERLGPCAEQAEAAAALSCLVSSGPLHRLSARYGARADRIAASVDRLPVTNRVLFFTSLRSYTVSDWADAEKRARRCVEVASELGDLQMHSQGNAVLIQALFNSGATRAAHGLGAQMDEDGRRRHYPAVRIWGLVGRAQAGQRMGLFEESIPDLRESLRLLVDSTDRWSETVALGLLALAQLRCEEPDEARIAADRTIAMMRSYPLPTQPILVWGYLGAAEVYRALWTRAAHAGAPAAECKELERVTRWCARKLHVVRHSFLLGRPHAWLFQGRLHMIAGKERAARRCWQRALAATQSIELPYERGMSHLELGRIAIDPADRTEHLQKAVEHLEQVSAQRDLEAARTALASTDARS